MLQFHNEPCATITEENVYNLSPGKIGVISALSLMSFLKCYDLRRSPNVIFDLFYLALFFRSNSKDVCCILFVGSHKEYLVQIFANFEC